MQYTLSYSRFTKRCVIYRVSSMVTTQKSYYQSSKSNNICFMYAIPISLFHEVLGKNPGRISKRLTDIVNVFNWHEIDFLATYDDYITFERSNNKVALNVLYVPLN